MRLIVKVGTALNIQVGKLAGQDWRMQNVTMVSALQRDPHQQEVGECMTVRQEVVFSSTPRLSHSFSLSAGKLEMLRLKRSCLFMHRGDRRLSGSQ